MTNLPDDRLVETAAELIESSQPARVQRPERVDISGELVLDDRLVQPIKLGMNRSELVLADLVLVSVALRHGPSTSRACIRSRVPSGSLQRQTPCPARAITS